MNEEMNFKPTLNKPVSDQSKSFEKNFKKTMVQNNVQLNEVDALLSEAEQSLKKKIFSLSKMEALVFSDPKLSAVYDEMAENGEEKYGYHYNETIQNMIFNDYVLNSPKYLQKYKQAIPKEKKRRDKSGINQLKKAGETKMEKSGLPKASEPDNVQETTTAASAGGANGYVGYAGPSAWGSGDLTKTKGKAPVKTKPMIAGGTIIGESNYLVDASGFEKYVNELNEGFENEDDTIINNTNAFNSDTVKNWNPQDKAVEMNTLQSGKMDEQNIDEKSKSKAQQRFMGMVHAVQKGELSADEVGGSVAKAADSMSYKDADDFASTKHKGLPEKIDETSDNDVMYVEYVSDRSGEEPFTIHGEKWQYVNAKYPSGKIDLGVYRYGEDLVYSYYWFQKNIIGNKTLGEDTQTMIQNNNTSMSNKAQATGDQSGNVPMGTQQSGNMHESDMHLLEELNKELEAFSVHHDKLKRMSEDRKPSSLVLKDRLGNENQSNFKKDLQHSGTKEIIDVEKELEWKDQQTDVKDPMKAGEDIEKKSVKDSLKNVGDSDNKKGTEIPKRNLTDEEQEEVNNYRNGMHSLVYDNKPNQRFEDRMKIDMGDAVSKIREKQLAARTNAPMYNKDTQPTEKGDDKSQFNREKAGWNDNTVNESMITGRYHDILGKRRLIDFTLNEVNLRESVADLFELDFTGLGNSYVSKTVDNKVLVNETVSKAMNTHKFYTDGKSVFAVKNPVKQLNESADVQKPVVNEQVNKMKHLLGYKPESFTDTKNVKKNRGF